MTEQFLVVNETLARDRHLTNCHSTTPRILTDTQAYTQKHTHRHIPADICTHLRVEIYANTYTPIHAHIRPDIHGYTLAVRHTVHIAIRAYTHTRAKSHA